MHLVNKSRYALSLQAIDREADPPRRVHVFLGTSATDSRKQVPDADWNVLEQHAGVKRWLRMGWLTPVRDRNEPPPKSDQTELSELNARESVEFVRLVTDPVELHDMLQGEERKTVRDAIEKRLGELRD